MFCMKEMFKTCFCEGVETMLINIAPMINVFRP
jgi:hypothetical protein